MRKTLTILLIVCMMALFTGTASAGGTEFVEVILGDGDRRVSTVLVDRETAENYRCFASVAGAHQEVGFTYQWLPELFVAEARSAANERFQPEQVGKWKFLRKPDLEMEAAGYTLYRLDTSYPVPAERMFERFNDTYEYNGELYYEFQHRVWYKYALLGDVNEDEQVDIDDILTLRNAIFGTHTGRAHIYYLPSGFCGLGGATIDDILAVRECIFDTW